MVSGHDWKQTTTMNIILLSKFCKGKSSVDICLSSAMVWLVPGLALFSAALVWAGYQWGLHQAGAGGQVTVADEIRDALDTEKSELARAQAEQRVHLDALALRVARLQAQLMRLDALGERLVGVGKLDTSEFDFSAVPAQGGLGDDGGASSSAQDIVTDLDRIQQVFADREYKLAMLETQLANRELMLEALPSGRPVDKGWISSAYGKRIDPISGKRRAHHGVDFAGKVGTPVRAVAAGVVIESGKANAYGNRIEIKHADGYSTVYAHNQKNMVEAGSMVAKGDVIALLGNTGRSTGPHVHFEVRKQGKVVNPARFIRAP